MRKIALSIVLLTASTHFILAEMQTVPSREEAFQEWGYSLAIQAATFGAPIVTMYAFRDKIAFGSVPKAIPNHFWFMEDVSTPTLSVEAGYVTPNVNVVYGFGFMDLREGPVLIEAPDSQGRYYMIEILDMWTNAFAYIGGKATGYKGGKYLLTPPGWEGTLPLGVHRIECPTPWVLLQPRVHVYSNGKVDLEGAQKVLHGIQLTSLSESSPKYDYLAPEPVNSNLPVSVMQYKDPLQFWEILAIAMDENPPPQDQISALLPLFKPLGIELGKPWDRSKLDPRLVQIMSRAASQIGSILGELPVGTNYQGAHIPSPSIGDFGSDYQLRAVIARVGFTANTPLESIYWTYARDKNGDLLTGEKNYRMTFKEAIPFEEPGFWSITLYDASNNYTVPNQLNRYMLGSDTRKLKKNLDGSFTIYIQQKSPGKNKESNWLPAPPGPFYLIPRSYPPTPTLIRLLTDVKAWPIPVIELEI